MRIVTLFMLFSLSPLLFAKAHLDGIAAIVNNNVITKSELDNQINMAKQQLPAQARPSSQDLKKQVLENLILKEIQLQLAKKTGLEIDEMTLDSSIENMAKQNNMTVSQLRKAMQQEGLNFNDYRQTMRQQLVVSKLQQREILNDVHVSEQEVKQFMQSPNGLGNLVKEYKLSHILISLPESPTPDEINAATQKAKDIVTTLRNQGDFVKVAMAESSGEHALNGGDLGWRKLSEIPTLFVKTVPNLGVNEISDPIRSPSGFHIIKLSDKRTIQSAKKTIDKTLARHILIRTNGSTNDKNAKLKLTGLREKIMQGEDFARLANTHSDDLGSASQGGMIGWVNTEMLVPEFSQMMNKMAVNEISQPFKTSFGWHIVQVMDRQAHESDENELRQKAQHIIQQRKYEERLHAWQRQLRDEAFVKIYS